MTEAVFTLFDAIGLLASIASLILSVVAIVLALFFKTEADRVNKETINLLVEIRTDAKSISTGVMEELRAYGNTMRGALTTRGLATEPVDFEFLPANSQASTADSGTDAPKANPG